MQGVLRTQKVKNTARDKSHTMGIQQGSVATKFGTTLYYKSFPTAFAAAPDGLQLTPRTGTVVTMVYKNLNPGSFNVVGTPVNKYVWYTAYGSLTV